MPAEARVTPIWKKQKLFIAVFLFAFAAYFCWDGAVGYPRADERYRAWKSHHDAGRLAEWPAAAQQRGWKVDEWQKWLADPHQQGQVPPERHGRGKIIEQFVCAALAGLGGAFALAYWLAHKGRSIRSDAAAVYTPKAVRVPFDSIIGVGKKKWDAKGLATVRYEVAGRRGEFALDDYKFDRDPTHQILAEIEAHLAAPDPEPPTT